MNVEWTGNPLSKDGTTGRIGPIEADLRKVWPSELGLVECLKLGQVRVTKEFRRTWVLNICDKNDMRIDTQCLTSVVLVNMMPEVAKREAEELMRWALTYHGYEDDDE